MSDPDDTADGPTVETAGGESDRPIETARGDDGHDAETDGGDTLDPVADEGLGSSVQTGRPESIETPETIDRRGWLLVAAVVVSFVVMPLVVYFIPELHWFIAALGLSQRQAYILFPMLPTLVLGLVAVWASFGLRS